MSCIDALYIFEPFSNSATPLLQYEWRRQSTPSEVLISAYNAAPNPRPSLLYIPTTSPPTLLFNITHNNLIFLSPATSEIEPLLVLEFLHRVVDILEDYFSPPLIATKIESNYDVIAQLLGEMCDDGYPFTTEPNALRDLVLPPSLMGKIIGSVTGLPSSSVVGGGNQQHTQLSDIPWRRSNVKHTNNELYVDIIEVINATIAPSGRPLMARANGTVMFTSKVSGVPDLLLTLSTPGGGYGKKMSGNAGGFGILEFPLFHPCVRLNRWRNRPGELSFVPPDGKFVLASYEVDLLPNLPTKAKKAANSSSSNASSSSLQLPISLEIRKNLGEQQNNNNISSYNNEFEVRVFVNPSAVSSNASIRPSAIGSNSRFGNSSPAFGGSSNNPSIEDIIVTIPLPATVKTLINTRISRGEFHFEKGQIKWKINNMVPSTSPTSSAGSPISSGMTATFRTGIALKSGHNDDGHSSDEEEEEREDKEEGTGGSYNDSTSVERGESSTSSQHFDTKASKEKISELKKRTRLESSMPRCAWIGFSVRGWLASGVKVDSLKIVSGKGLGEGVKPYKGVKYLTRTGNVEARC